MGRLNIGALKKPKKKYDITRFNPQINKSQRFETKEECQNEDKLRLKLINKFRRKNDRANIEKINKHLKLLTKKIKRSKTPASRVFMRKWRRNVINSIYNLPVENGDSLIFFTIIPKGFSFEGGRLDEADASELMERIRLMFWRNGSSEMKGWIYCYLHGEYEPESNFYMLHVHGIATPDYKEVLERMRSSCHVLRSNSSGNEPNVRKRLQVSRKPIDDPFKVISYCAQSYWPMRHVSYYEKSKMKRQRIKQRIINPYHTEYLLWLSKIKLKNLVFSKGFHVNKNGKLTRNANVH